MKSKYLIVALIAAFIANPLAANANAIIAKQAKTEHMRACLSKGGSKESCGCSYDRLSAELSSQDILNLSKAIASKLPSNERHYDRLDRISSNCLEEIREGKYVPKSASPATAPAGLPAAPALPTPPAGLPTPPALPTPPSLPKPQGLPDIGELKIPEPPLLKKAAPSFDEEKADDSVGYFSDTEIDLGEDADKVNQKAKSASSPNSAAVDVAVQSLKEGYNGQHNAAFFTAAAGNDLVGLRAISQYLNSPDITDRDGNTPLFTAVTNGHIAAVKFLLEIKANPNLANKSGQSPLHIAVFKRRQDIAQLLLANKADINAAYSNGFTPAILAIMNRDEVMLQNLLMAGADIKKQMRDGNFPIHVATTTDSARVIQVLKNYGADINAENGLGYTPLMVAASQNKVASTSALLALGADFNRTDIYGRTAAQIAYSLDYTQIVNLILTVQEKQRMGL